MTKDQRIALLRLGLQQLNPLELQRVIDAKDMLLSGVIYDEVTGVG